MLSTDENDFCGGVWIGQGAPDAAITKEKGRWTLRPLVQDEASKGTCFTTLVPAAPTIAEESKDDFISRIESMEWPYGP